MIGQNKTENGLVLEEYPSELLKKYNIYADDYSDYPHKSNWSENMGENEYRAALKRLFSPENNPPTLFYAHIPFCKSLCYYCICHKEITSNYQKVQDHLNRFLFKEIDLLNDFFVANELTPNFTEIFLGGGSPTILTHEDFDRLIQRIQQFCDISKLQRFCIEVDPRTTSSVQLDHYARNGVTTLSLGIQDFDVNVQKAINRVQPVGLVRELLRGEMRGRFSSINFDFLIGLPLQTMSSIEATIQEAIDLSPDRISLCFFHYQTKFYSYMRKLKDKLPTFSQRKALFARAVEMLMAGGYIRTGFEHFAKQDDIVAQSVSAKKATYTSLGAISGNTVNVVATGRSGHSIVGQDYLFQNYYEQELYAGALSQGQFPIYRGMKLSPNDMLRREMIRTVKTYFSLNILEIEKKIDASFKTYFCNELQILDEFIKDGLVMLSDEELKVTEKGKIFTDLIASVFDDYNTKPRFNR